MQFNQLTNPHDQFTLSKQSYDKVFPFIPNDYNSCVHNSQNKSIKSDGSHRKMLKQTLKMQVTKNLFDQRGILQHILDILILT